MATLKELRDERLRKLSEIKKLGINPYPPSGKKTHDISLLIDDFENLQNKDCIVAGRIMSIRNHGKLSFLDLKDESGTIQLYIKEDTLKKEKNSLGYDELCLLDTGDFVQAEGKLVKTQRGQISIETKNIVLLNKSLRPLPSEYYGIQDTEERYRKRYLDFILNDKSKKFLDVRWKMTQKIREFLWSKGFVEVETPILQPLYGGTNAKPFVTHMNALDHDFYLRIAPELYLKRLIIGGYEKVFEIARNFRNEGIDQTHFPEFSMLEWYEAYADYNRVMDLAEDMTKFVVKNISGSTKINVNGKQIEIGNKWNRISMEDLLKEKMGIDWETAPEGELAKIANDNNLKIKGHPSRNKLLYTIVDKLLTPNLIDPTFVIDHPKEVSPLAKEHRSKKGRTERFEGYIGGVEIYDGWSEIVSGIEQRERFENEQKNMREGDEEAMPFDEDFVEALEYGCPPLGGIGFGIERMAMFLTDNWSIKEVTAFPILKPEK